MGTVVVHALADVCAVVCMCMCQEMTNRFTCLTCASVTGCDLQSVLLLLTSTLPFIDPGFIAHSFIACGVVCGLYVQPVKVRGDAADCWFCACGNNSQQTVTAAFQAAVTPVVPVHSVTACTVTAFH